MINWLEEAKKRQDEMVQALSLWLQNNSVYDPDTAGEGAPFGKGVKEAFDYILGMAEKDGFAHVNDDGYACHIDYGTGETIVGILGHVDVVPEGDGWSFPPFSGAVENGHIYGRGSQDDKGPVMASYFALKIIKDLGLPLSKKVRMILGGNEEREWKCVDHYFKNYPKPDFGFTPDGDFPLVYAEKEIQMYEFTGKYPADSLISFKSGTAANSVPDHATAMVSLPLETLEKPFNQFLQNNKLQGSIAKNGSNVQLDVIGISAHGSTPEVGVNAAVYLMGFLKQHTGNKMIAHFADVFSDYNGKGMNITFDSEKMGNLTANLGIVDYENGSYRFVLDSRYPMEIDRDAMKKNIKEKTTGLAWESEMKEAGFKKGIYLDLESDLIKTLHKAYVDHTGDTETKPYAIGGGTYARATDNIACFGMSFPYSKRLFHQKNEAVNIEEFVLATAIYAQAIYDLAK